MQLQGHTLNSYSQKGQKYLSILQKRKQLTGAQLLALSTEIVFLVATNGLFNQCCC